MILCGVACWNLRHGFSIAVDFGAARKVYQIPEGDLYKQSCKQLGVIPASEYIHHLSCEVLNLKQRGLGPQGVRALSRALVINPSVVSLDLEENNIRAEGLHHIAAMLKENLIITHLNLANNNLGLFGARPIHDILKENNTLRSLNLSGNNFRDLTAKKIASGLEENTGLLELNLSKNEFQEIGGKHFGAALVKNETLLNLNLSWNRLTKSGALGMCVGIRKNKKLKQLNLSWNGFDDSCGIDLALALKDNSSLLELDFSHNHFTTEGVIYLARGLKMNDTLQVVKVGDNPITGTGAVIILKAINMPTNSVRYLDLKEIRVTREFIKVLTIMKRTRNITVLYGRTIRKSIFPKSYFISRHPQAKVMKEHPLETMQRLAEEKGLDVKEILKKLIQPAPPRVEEGEEPPLPSPPKDPFVSREIFINALVDSDIGIYVSVADYAADLLIDSQGRININSALQELDQRGDDLEEELPELPKPKEDDKKKPKGKGLKGKKK